MAKNTLRVRVKAKAQNAILARLADQEGGVIHAAKAIGITAASYYTWLNLRGTPWGKHGNLHSRLNSERARNLVLKLEELTGESICDIFPISKKQLEPLAATREYERDVEMAALENYAQDQAARIEENINEGQRNLEEAESHAGIVALLDTLPLREREILKLRYGIGDGHTYTLDEVAHIFKVTRERVRQIELRAIRKLQQPSCSGELAFYCD